MIFSARQVSGQTLIPAFGHDRPTGGLVRFLKNSDLTDLNHSSIYGPTVEFMPTSRPAPLRFQRRPTDTEAVRNEKREEHELLNQIILSGGAGFLGGIFALRGTDQPAIHVGAGISLGALSALPFRNQRSEPGKYALYGAGVGGFAAGMLSLFSQF